MQPAAGGGTGAGNIAAILRNFRFDQYDVQQCGSPRGYLSASAIRRIACLNIVSQTFHKINLKNLVMGTFHSIHINYAEEQ